MIFFISQNKKNKRKLEFKRSILLCQCQLSWATDERVSNKMYFANKLSFPTVIQLFRLDNNGGKEKKKHLDPHTFYLLVVYKDVSNLKQH